MFEMLQFEFVRNAFLAAILASIACGIISAYVVVKRLVFISDGITHAAFGGIGLSFWLGLNPFVLVLPCCLLTAVTIGLLAKKTKIAEDTAIGILWSLGMALGVLFIALAHKYTPDLLSYLFGNILTVPRQDLYLMLGVNIFIVLAVFLFYRQFLAICFDEEYAKTQGLPVLLLYLFLLCLTALTIVSLIRVVGIILVMALLTIPATLSQQFTAKMHKIMLLSIVFGLLFTLSGLILSFYFDLPSGATIIIVAALCYFSVLGGKKIQQIFAKKQRIGSPLN